MFVQSTSNNRVLVPGTEFLYDIGGSEIKGEGDDHDIDAPSCPDIYTNQMNFNSFI